MALAAGDKLGPYEIVGRIGAGGMGEVYRARDARLNRDVAIKVSNAQFSDRFAREARSIAALNHTNICHLYDVGPDYLVMEYVEGADLRGPLTFDEALPVVCQLIDGIEAAHERNIIHRDLKPANIKVTPAGVVKILDFGLAKAMEAPASSDVQAENSPTITIGATQAGAILGTAAYMAPEQAKGKAADKRADIWSFGVIVYELLTGERLFRGDSAVEILGSVLNREPDLSAVPERARKLLGWCLEKDRKDRLQAIGDARRLLAEESAPEGTGARPLRKQPAMWALTLIAAAALGFALWSGPAGPPRMAAHLTMPLPAGQEITSYPAITRDGTTVAYVAQRGAEESQLYLRDLNSFEARPVAGSSGAKQPFFSLDGKWVAYFAQGQLLKAEVAGGAPIKLAEAAYPFGGTWTEDNTIIYTSSLGSGLLRIPAGGGMPETLTKPDGAAQGYAHVFPRALPGNRGVFFTVWGQAEGGAVLSFHTNKWDLIVPETTFDTAIFTSTGGSAGRLLISDQNFGVKAAPFDAAHPARTSVDASVLTDVFSDVESEPQPWMDVSGTGTMVYAPGNPGKTSLVWVDRSGRVEPVSREQNVFREAGLSPDGSKALVKHGLEVWIHDLKRGTESRLTPPNSGANVSEVWTRDGTHIIFGSNRGGNWDIYSQPADGSKPAEVLLQRPYDQFPCSIAPDGTLLYVEIHPKTGRDLWILSPDGKAAPLRITPFNETNAQFSPSAAGAPRWVAYSSDESGRNEVYVQSYPSGANRIAVSNGGGIEPRWSRDGKQLFYVSGDALVAVEVQPDGSFSAPRRLFDRSDYFFKAIYGTYDVSPDGKRFLMIQRDPGSAPRQLNVILNWTAELDRAASAGKK